MSRAVLNWARLGSPEAFLNVVYFIPSARARLVIITANFRSVPPSASASTVATSLADFVASALIAVSTVIVSPRRSPSFDGERPSATRETRYFCLSLSFLVLSASKVMNSVIIFVSEAG